MNNQTPETPVDTTDGRQAVDSTDGVQLAACYLTRAVTTMYDEGRLRPLHVDTTLTDEDGTGTVFRINLEQQPGDNTGGMVASGNLKGRPAGDLWLLAGAALALYAGARAEAMRATDTEEE